MDTDERFSHIARDPRFKKIPNRKKKVKIDSRFQQMFSDENFNTKYFVDKRGRKVKESANEDLSNFYKLSDEDQDVNLSTCDSTCESKVEGSEETVLKKKKKKKKKKSELKDDCSTAEDQKKRRKKAKKDTDEIKKDDESLPASSHKLTNDNNVLENWLESEASAPVTEESTSRLAVCNMDWDKITADDLFVLFHSFLPSGRSIYSINIYPSQYGLERMEKEDEIGPTELVSTGNHSDDEMEYLNKDKNSEYNQEKLRQYQLNRLRYYYAVVECDCSDTAEKIYEECDGMEYEASSSHLDLRFIPQDMVFEHDPTSVATVLPSAETYKPSEFITTALQQSTVRLTWDETDPKRIQATMKNFSKDDLLEMDFKAYLASSASEDESEVEEEEEENENRKESQDVKIAKYKELLEEINQKDRENESENEMEVTWEVGLKETTEELVKRKKNEKEQKRLTPWENYLNEKKHKKKIKQLNQKDESQSATHISDDELPADVDLNDPFFAEELEKTGKSLSSKTNDGKKKRKRRREPEESEEEKRRKAELQLLVMEEDDNKKHFSLKSIMKNEKKNKRKKKNKLEEPEKDDFEIDVHDNRFSALYSSHHYAVDPSDPQFKKTKAMDSIIREKQRRSDTRKEGDKKKQENKQEDVINTSNKKKAVDPGLSALIKTVKSNAVKYQDNRNKGTRKK